MTRNAALMLLGLFLIATLSSCGGTVKTGITPPASTEIIESAPKWYLNPPKDDEYIAGTGTATSRDMQLARDKAVESARLDVSKSLEIRFEAISKRFQEEVGTAIEAQYLDQFTQASKSTVSQVLIGATVDQTSLSAEKGVFRAFALVKVPMGAASEALVNRIKQEEQLYTRFRSTQVFDELNKETEKFEEWKKGEQK